MLKSILNPYNALKGSILVSEDKPFFTRKSHFFTRKAVRGGGTPLDDISDSFDLHGAQLTSDRYDFYFRNILKHHSIP